MKFLITGASGQLGREWCMMLENSGHEFIGLSSASLDIRDATLVQNRLRTFTPDILINCAAYTNVDKAEDEAGKAHAVNKTGVKHLAFVCRSMGIRLVHYSTDYVFSGAKEDRSNYPDGYPEDAFRSPVNLYGESKYAGELTLEESGCDYLLLRVSWLCGAHGSNFVRKILELSETREELAVVEDQIGSPAFTFDVAEKSLELLRQNRSGTFHVSSSGVLSWADLAEEVFRLNGISTNVRRVPSSEYQTIAKRPSYSLLSKQKLEAVGIKALEWKSGLKRLLNEIGTENSRKP